MIFCYFDKEHLRRSIGKPIMLDHSSSKVLNGRVAGSNKPSVTGFKKEFWAFVTLKDGIIIKVE